MTSIIPRWLYTTNEDDIELIGFSDASGVAKAVVVYSRVRRNGRFYINLVGSKGNVNKLNTVSIIESKQNTVPKNELDAVVILVDLLTKVREVLDHKNIRYRAYTDSQIALSWI